MDAEDGSSDKRLRDSVSMVIRQLRGKGQPSREGPVEVPESDEGEIDQAGNEDDSDNDSSNADREQSDHDRSAHEHTDSDDGDNEAPQRRQSVSSDGSSYHASNASEAEAASPSHFRVKAEPPHRPQRAQPRSPFSTVPPTPTQRNQNRFSSPLKRSRSRSISPSTSGTASPHSPPPTAPRRLKRHKAGAPLNHAYLALLNEDIRDAAARFVPPITGLPTNLVNNNDTAISIGGGGGGGGGGVDDLHPSQHGLTSWSPAEKALFFEALARVGRDDVPAIAARVRTKGVVECAAYLAVLKDAATVGEGGVTMVKGEKGEKVKEVERVVPAEIPAAVEVSVACCAALEEAADVVAAWQEGYEEAEERKRWGGGGGGGGGKGDGIECWLIERGNWREMEKAPPEGMHSMGLFHAGNWLRLSERVFMNSAVEEYHWESVGEGRPAVRATALEDFYALAVETTRRLVAATVFVAESRVKARKELYPDTRRRVWKQDVEAAALSLGLPTDSRKFWAKCARRLRLDVYDDENDDAGWDGGKGEQRLLTFDQVEKALGLDTVETDIVRDDEESSEEEEADAEDDLTSGPGSDHGSVELEGATPYASEHEEAAPEHDTEEKDTIKREMDELLVHSALEYPNHGKAREALRSRIRAERAREAYAAALDNRASYYEEKRLWEMLDRQPPVAMVKVELPQEPHKLTRKTAGGMIQASARTPGDWRSKLEALPSRWEMEFALVEEERRQKKVQTAATGSESGGEN